jgi:hypothetical protein
MRPVPGWFAAACWFVAIGCALLAGYHYNAPDAGRWIALYGAAGIAAALLQARRRVLAFAALGIGAADGAWSTLELLRLANVVAARDLWPVGAIAIAATWLVLGALLRATMRF